MKKYLIFIFVTLLFSANAFAALEEEIGSKVNKVVNCSNYGISSSCECHYAMYKEMINGTATYNKGRGWNPSNSEMLLAKQRACMRNYGYSDYGEYQKKLKYIPNLASPSGSNKGNIREQYLYNKETEDILRKKNPKKADKYLDKNIEILIANMMETGWAAKNLLNHLYAQNLTEEQKEIALQTLTINLPNVGRCKARACQIPGTVGDVAELFRNCEEDACLLTALHVELFNSLIQSGAKGTDKNGALTLLSNMLVKDVTNTDETLKRFGDKQANSTVKIPILKAILELGDEDYYVKVTQKILDKKGVATYSNSDAEVISFIIDTYRTMHKWDPLIKYAFGKNTNAVTRNESMIALAEMSSSEGTTNVGIDILSDDEKQRIANYLHSSYSDNTTACVRRNQEGVKTNGNAVLAGLKNAAEIDVMLKHKMCHAYKELGVKSTEKNLVCYPCEGNMDADMSTIVQETAISFFLDTAVDTVITATLTLGTGLVAKKMIDVIKYSEKMKALQSKIKNIKIVADKATDGQKIGKTVPFGSRASTNHEWNLSGFRSTKNKRGRAPLFKADPEPSVAASTKSNTTVLAGKSKPKKKVYVTDEIEESSAYFGNTNSGTTGTPSSGSNMGDIPSSSRPGLVNGDRPAVVDPNAMKGTNPSGRPNGGGGVGPKRPGSVGETPSGKKPSSKQPMTGKRQPTTPNSNPSATPTSSPSTPSSKPNNVTTLSGEEVKPKLTDDLDNAIEGYRESAGFRKQLLPNGQNTATDAPDGFRKAAGFQTSTKEKYIPESKTLSDPNGPGVQGSVQVEPTDNIGFNKGSTPRDSTPNVKNQAGGATPDTPGAHNTPGQGSQVPNQSTPVKDAAAAAEALERQYFATNIDALEDLQSTGKVIDDLVQAGCSSRSGCIQAINKLLEQRSRFNSQLSSLHKKYNAFMKSDTDLDGFIALITDRVNTIGNNTQGLTHFLEPDAYRRFILGKGKHRNKTRMIVEEIKKSNGINYTWTIQEADVKNIEDLIESTLASCDLDDLTRILKSDIPSDLQPLGQLTDWDDVVSHARRVVEKELDFNVEKYEDLLWQAERTAPGITESIKGGAKPNSAALMKGGIDEQTANNIVEYYQQIENLRAALK